MKSRLSLLLLSIGFLLQAQTINTTLVYKVKVPLKRTEKVPVLILLHGYGSNEEDLFDLGNTMDERFITFSLRAPMVLPGGGFCWYKLETAPNNQFKYDYAEVKKSREKVLSFIQNACRAYQLDSTQLFLLGFSQGAILSYDIAFSNPGKIKGVLALSGRLMNESKTYSSTWGNHMNTGFFIGHGNFDNVILIKEAEAAQAFLTSKGIKQVTYKNYNMQHVINGAELNDLKSWLSKALEQPKASEAKKTTAPAGK